MSEPAGKFSSKYAGTFPQTPSIFWNWYSRWLPTILLQTPPFSSELLEDPDKVQTMVWGYHFLSR